MKVTNDIIKKLDISERDKLLLTSLLKDIDSLNRTIQGSLYKKDEVYISYQDYHDEYSPERVDPCPDYYGYYTLVLANDNSQNTLGFPCKINELDHRICVLIEFVESLCQVIPASANVDFYQVVEQTPEEKFKMYMDVPHEDLIRMKIEEERLMKMMEEELNNLRLEVLKLR